MKKIAVVAIAVLALTGCSSGGKEPNLEGCTKSTIELTWVTEMYECGGTQVYFFDTAEHMKSWKDIADATGYKVTEQGSRWLRVEVKE